MRATMSRQKNKSKVPFATALRGFARWTPNSSLKRDAPEHWPFEGLFEIQLWSHVA